MNCQNCTKQFEISYEQQNLFEKLGVPAPTFCPHCRLVRRMAYRNERTLYRRKCDAPDHDEEVISVFSPNKEDRIYCQKSWWGDAWDGTTYARDYDFSKPFFLQMRELWKEVPDMALLNINPVNSDYCSITEGNKNCYLVIGGDYNEDSMYSAFVFNSKNVVDCYWLKKCEFCYEVSESMSCTNLSYSKLCEGCFDSAFLYNCKNSHHCFGCVNLKNASYQIFNEQYSKEGYEAKLKELGIEDFSNREQQKQAYEDFIKKFPRKYARILASVECTGDNIEHAKNVKDSFDVFDGAEDSFNLWLTYSQIKDSSDLDHSGRQTELSYECSTLYPASRVFFSRFIFTGHDIEYSYNCHNSSYLFGCVGLKNKQYCILNKQYTKEEYENLVPKIKAHMNEMPYITSTGVVYKYGEFFPIELSPFAYNETVAFELEPMSKEGILSKGYSFEEQAAKQYTITKNHSELPQKIAAVDESVTKEIISCAHEGKCNHGCSTAFRITKEELEFYQRMNIPLPHVCSNCRHYERIAYRNPLHLWKRECDCKGISSQDGMYTNEMIHPHGQKSAELNSKQVTLLRN
jgi:hypothetical protein